MPLKDQLKKTEASKERMRRYRDKQKGVTKEGVTGEGVTFKDGIEYVSASYVQGLEGRMYEALPERPRYLTLSDGQVLDRLVPPVADLTRIHQMRMCNESSYNFHPSRGILPHSLAITKGSQTNIQAIKK